VAEATVGRVASGALVFDAGSLFFPRGLGTAEVRDPRVERMVANLIHEAIGIPVPKRVGLDPARPRGTPSGPYAPAVRTLATGLDRPSGIAVLPGGSLVVAETGAHRLAGISRTGTVSVLAGGDGPGHADGPGVAASFSGPTGLAVGPDGTLYVADTGNHCLRRVAFEHARTVATLAGRCGDRGRADGPAGVARFLSPQGIAYDPASGLLWVADTGNDRIATVDPATGAVVTLAAGRGAQDGPLATATFRDPTGLAALGDGRMVVVDSGNARLRLVAGRQVTTLAGGAEGFGDGPGDDAALAPQGPAAWDGTGVVFADPPAYRVRRAIPGTPATVHTLAGGAPTEADGPGETARIGLPAGVAVDATGTLYVTDGLHGTVRTILRR
jgi:DNA-binding beta-propeller fold protein YncE